MKDFLGKDLTPGDSVVFFEADRYRRATVKNFQRDKVAVVERFGRALMKSPESLIWVENFCEDCFGQELTVGCEVRYVYSGYGKPLQKGVVLSTVIDDMETIPVRSESLRTVRVRLDRIVRKP